MRRTSEIGVRQMLPIDAFEALEEAVFVASNLVLAYVTSTRTKDERNYDRVG